MASVMIIGIGNVYRSDDGAGIAVARRLRESALPGVTVIEIQGEGTAVIEAWRDAGTVVVIDAVRSHAPPGTIHRFDAREEILPAEVFRCSTHTFGLAEAVELARTLGWLPSVLTVYGIEGASFEAGTARSPHVEQAVDRLVEQIITEFGGVAARGPSARA